MPATPLTDHHWRGLPLLVCRMDPGLYRLEVESPVLVLREDLGTQVEVMSNSGRRLTFRQAPLRMDLFGRGLQMNAVSDRVDTRSAVIALPNAWLPDDPSAAQGHVDLTSRFQFSDAALRRQARRLLAHYQAGEPLGAPYTEALSRNLVDRVVFGQLAADASRSEEAGLSAEAKRFIADLVDAHLESPPTLVAMASALGMGVARFTHDFKLSFGATPHQYLQRRRLARACERLMRTDASLTTIALETGYSSHAHFSTVFRAAMGITPSGYRLARADRLAATADVPSNRDSSMH